MPSKARVLCHNFSDILFLFLIHKRCFPFWQLQALIYIANVLTPGVSVACVMWLSVHESNSEKRWSSAHWLTFREPERKSSSETHAWYLTLNMTAAQVVKKENVSHCQQQQNLFGTTIIWMVTQSKLKLHLFSMPSFLSCLFFPYFPFFFAD